MLSTNEMYEENSKKRKIISYVGKILMKIGINKREMAFQYKCSYCLSEFNEKTLTGVETFGGMSSDMLRCTEDHDCSKCKKKWHYMTMRRKDFKYPIEDPYITGIARKYFIGGK